MSDTFPSNGRSRTRVNHSMQTRSTEQLGKSTACAASAGHLDDARHQTSASEGG